MAQWDLAYWKQCILRLKKMQCGHGPITVLEMTALVDAKCHNSLGSLVVPSDSRLGSLSAKVAG